MKLLMLLLKLMNRCYDVNYFIKRIEEIKRVRDDMSITTDLIVGFPGETDDDFKDTLNTLDKIGFTKIHVFPYSKRDNTKASKMKDQVDGNIKKQRVKEVLKKSLQYENKYYNKFINSMLDGVSEVKKNGETIVHTSNFIPVLVKDNISNNKIVKVRIDKVSDDNIVYGTVV